MYKNLFTPIKVGNMVVKNRIFMPPMSTHLANEKGEVTEDLLAYYEARARGGVGLITIPSILIEEESRYGTYRNLGLYEDRHIENVKLLTDRIHLYKTKVAAQLLHASAACPSSYNNGRQPIAASAVMMGSYREVPRALTKEEIKEYVGKFVNAALRSRAAGFDAIELHCCHRHGLLGGFLSPLLNKRTDEYGGDIDGRLRFPLEVLREIRKEMGNDYPIIVRMSITDDEPGGQSLLEGIYIANQFEQNGASMLHLSNGTLDAPWKTAAPSGTAPGFNGELASRIKASVNIPVGVVGRIYNPWIGELMLQKEYCDVVYVGRALICDPEFPEKAAQNRKDIRPCIGCLRCLMAANTDQPFGCTMNPEAGQEGKKYLHAPNIYGKNILVIGGGPAGLVAAAYCAKRNHKVLLAEKESTLGGQMSLAAIPPCKQDIAPAVSYLAEAARNSGVEIRCNWEVTPDQIKKEDYHLVIVATGTNPIIPGFLKGSERVVTANQVLKSETTVGKNIVVLGGGAVGCETADYLLHPHLNMGTQDRQVTIIEQADFLMENEKTSARSLLVQRLLQKGCHIHTGCTLTQVHDAVLQCTDKTGNHFQIENVDTIVVAVGNRHDNALEESLRAKDIEVKVIENSLSIKTAIAEAFEYVNNNL